MPLPEKVREEARRLWRAGRYWEVHEVLEPYWLRAKGEKRELLQGVIQLAAALHKARSNRRGAERLFKEALGHLRKGLGLEAEAFAAGVKNALSHPDEPPPFPLDQ